MRVRCSNCNSAFAVDDEKVENKKFAFTCPKCDSENVLDNRTRRKPVSAGPSVIDESYQNDDMPQTGVTGKERERGSIPDDSGTLDLDGIHNGATFSDSEDLSGLAEPEKYGDIDGSLDLADLPPADDMRSDVPLDDLAIDDAIEEMNIPDVMDEVGVETAKAGQRTVDSKVMEDEWAGLEEEIDGFHSESAPIRDELEPHVDSDEPVELEELDDIDRLLAEEENDKEITDDFEPLTDESRSDQAIGESEISLDDDIKTEEMYRAGDDNHEESITIDLDTLDIDLEDSAGKGSGGSPSGTTEYPGEGADGHTSPHRIEEDENITIDLDSLDIELQEGDEFVSGERHEELDLDLSDFSDESIRELNGGPRVSKTNHDDDITLDLDTLDISLEESDEFREGEKPGHDEKLTLEDAGLTMDELTTEDLSMVAGSSGAEEEEMRLSIDDIDPDLDMHSIEKELREAESILSESSEGEVPIVDELSELPDVDFDELLENERTSGAGRVSKVEKDLIDLDLAGKGFSRKWGLQKELPDMVPHGSVNFSIDYSIRYSRMGAFFRLFGLFFIGLIPHYLVFFVYALLSLILGFLNHVVVIATRKNVEDFSEIHENTLRYLLSISASMTGVVEEMPIFAGRDNIDYPLQMKIIYPLRSSRVMAMLRLSGIGILAAVLPHLLVLSLMSIMAWFVYIIGIFSVVIFGRWPHILFDFMTRYYRYAARVLAFVIGIVDVYPRFSFE